MKLKKLKKNSKIAAEVYDFYHNFSNQVITDLTNKFSEKYGVPVSNIDIITKYIQKTSSDTLSDNNVSNAVLDTILDPLKLKDNYVSFLEDRYPNLDLKEFFKIDRLVSEDLPDLEKFNTKNRNYKVLYIRGENIFSYTDFYRDFTKNKGINSIRSNPENQGGKSALTRMKPFLFFGNKIKYVDKSVTFAQIFNKYVESKTAFIEGEFEMNGEVYYIRRELTKKRKSVTHNVIFHRYDEAGEDNNLRMPSINLGIKNPTETQKIIESYVGTYKDFVFANYYEYHNIEQWIQTKPKQIYRLFCEYLGLALLESKYQIVNKILNNHQKTSLISKYSITELEEEIKQIKNTLSDLDVKKEETIEKINSAEKKVLEYEGLIKKEYNQKHPIDSKLESYDINKAKDILKKLLEDSAKLSTKVLNAEAKVRSYTSEYKDEEYREKIQKERLNLIAMTQNVTVDESLKIALESLEKTLVNVELSEDEKLKVSNVEKCITELTIKHASLGSEIKSLLEQIDKMPDEIVCKECGHVEDTKETITELKESIETKKSEQSEIVKNGKSLRKELKTVEKNNEESLKKQRDKLFKAISSQKILIEEARQGKISKFKEEIQILDNKLETFNCYNKDLVSLESLKSKLVEVETKADNKSFEVASYENNLEKIQKNIDISNIINEINIEKSNYVEFLNKKKRNLSEIDKDIGVAEYKVSQNNDLIVELKKDYEYQKLLTIYKEVHSEDGLSKHIILSILPQINSDLAFILNDICDFDLSIHFDDSKIEFLLHKDREVQELYLCKKKKKTISCLALHFVNCRMTTLPLSNNLVLDEILARVAPCNFKNVVKIIKRLCEVFETVDLITHIDGESWLEIKPMFSNEILIEKNNNISRIIK